MWAKNKERISIKFCMNIFTKSRETNFILVRII
jgi:hypothetical protein